MSLNVSSSTRRWLSLLSCANLRGSDRFSALPDSPFHIITGLCPRGVIFCDLEELLPQRDLALGLNLPLYPLVSLRRLKLSELASTVDTVFKIFVLLEFLFADF